MKSFQISRLRLFEMINELFADTVVISHHEELFTSPSLLNEVQEVCRRDKRKCQVIYCLGNDGK